jgi:hydroxyacylglutathione hydrolase
MVEASSATGKGFEVHIIPMLDDNFCYYVTRDLKNQPGVLIDVSEPLKVKEFMQHHGITHEPNLILTTHHHWDHAGGNIEMKAMYSGM